MTQTYEYFRSPQPDPTWMSTVDNFERITQGLPSDYVSVFLSPHKLLRCQFILNG